VSSSAGGKVAVITGASSGIGHALARALATEGYRVGLMARRGNLLDEVARAIRAGGGIAEVATADVTHRELLRDAVHELAEQLGPIDLMIANAGVGMPTLLDPFNTADVEEMFQVNVLGVIYAFEAVIPSMLARRTGHLAAISSLAGDKGLPGESAYCASKAAVNTYMDGLRIRVRSEGIAVTTICPGFVQTPMTAVNDFPMPFVLSAEAAAARIIRALRERRKVVRFPWQTSFLMRLARWAPDALLDRLFRNYNEHPPMPPSTETAGATRDRDSTRSR
jgi:short-subunit dehydrogenase